MGVTLIIGLVLGSVFVTGLIVSASGDTVNNVFLGEKKKK